jgi:hypothetical protein
MGVIHVTLGLVPSAPTFAAALLDGAAKQAARLATNNFVIILVNPLLVLVFFFCDNLLLVLGFSFVDPLKANEL